jgi:NADPH:quinone reductase-like Zn-dependent oxidoreductase
MTDLVDRALEWVDDVHPHAPHLARTREWVLELDPEADEALQIAAVIHDIERAFPADEDPFDPTAAPGSGGYDEWHQRRSAQIGARWLREQHAPEELTSEVEALVLVHETGGSPRADVLQAADSLSFLETQTDLFVGFVREGRLSREHAEQKLRLMQERIRIPRAAELGAPRLEAALARLDAALASPNGGSMRAYVLADLDHPPALTEVAIPEIADDEVLVRVHATSVNPIDSAIAAGEVRGWMDYEFPVTLGRDLAGTVERVGAAVTRFKPGDDVFGYIAKPVAHDGSFAEYVAIPEDQFIVARPAGLDAVHGAALGLAAVTALMCLDATAVGAGDVLLVNGATGGVGGYAVQAAKALGADVIATARPGDEETHVRALGADAVVDWSAGDVGAAVRALRPDGVRALVDVVTDTPERFAALATTVLAPGGRAATTRGVADAELLGDIEATNVFSMPETALLERIAALVEAGRLRAPVAEVHAFDRIEDAFAALARGSLGKIAVTLVEGS